ncbi:MAG: BlaI/MecI/CopY family transcriptional regulator [Lachnospiraceae bacterium]|nr:BlaI/MecI/CopY family transcriptional regulator [Lachnospiraceae bacterium]MCI9389716.1 BlaI/MecI/CopY family transcriptional regulator [Lachnospiraceae bacterium]MCI9471959.1 BlaI/MecI/CopY family transcriptional regulator [Lachnospiraceae bacterium]
MLQQVSDYELELLKIIWAGNGAQAMYAEIMDALEKKGLSRTKNTVITLLSRLVNKGFLKVQKIGRRNQYIAIVSEEQYREAQTQSLLDSVYEGDAKGLVCTLIQGSMLSPEEYEELKMYWEAGKDKK